MRRVPVVAAIVAGGGAVLIGVARGSRRVTGHPRSILTNGMEETRFGSGERTLLWIPDPSHTSPSGTYLRFMAKAVAPFVEEGYCVHLVARKPGLTPDVTANDLARDYADVIEHDLGGRVDLVVADSQGGVIGYCLAALRPDLCRSLATVAASHRLDRAAREATVESARLLSVGRRVDAAAAVMVVQMPRLRPRWLVRLVAQVVSRVSFPKEYDPEDVLAAAEAVNAREVDAVLSDISVPVLVVCGDSDQFASLAQYKETASRIPDSTLIVYEGKGHLSTISDERLAVDVLDFAQRARSRTP
jgi:pimeloyl-ACP methyl ester carboxylesterase